MMRVVEELITPLKANYLLTKNKLNRKLAQRHVDFLANQMKDGSWMENGESLKFDKKDVLIDGQHRLSAIVKSGTSQKMLVVYGVESETFGTIDTGRARNAADILFRDKRKNHMLLASLARIILSYRVLELSTGTMRSHYVTNIKIKELVDADPYTCKSSSFSAGHKTLKRLVTPTVTAFLHYEFSAFDEKLAVDFLSKIDKGSMNIDCPSHVIREYFIRCKLDKVVLNALDYICLATKYFLLYCEAKKIKKFSKKYDIDRINDFILKCDYESKLRANSDLWSKNYEVAK